MVVYMIFPFAEVGALRIDVISPQSQVNNYFHQDHATSANNADDKMLMIWDLQPELDSQPHDSPSPGMDIDYRPQPTAYPIPFEHPLLSVCAHPSTSKELLVSDSRGSIYLTDWRTDFTDRTSEAWHHPNVLELVEPRAMADTVMGFSGPSTGSLAWSKENADMCANHYALRSFR